MNSQISNSVCYDRRVFSNGVPVDIGGLKKGLERDLESILDHSCHVVIEDIDTETGEIILRVELDLAELRDRLNEHGGYEDVDISISDDFTFQLCPTSEQE